MEEQAQDGLALLDYLGIPMAHIVGHSHGADVAIQMAVTSPKTVATLTLIEPPVPFLISPDALNFFLRVIGQAMAFYGTGDKKGTLDTWLGAAFGPGWEEVVAQTIPGGCGRGDSGGCLFRSDVESSAGAPPRYYTARVICFPC